MKNNIRRIIVIVSVTLALAALFTSIFMFFTYQRNLEFKEVLVIDDEYITEEAFADNEDEIEWQILLDTEGFHPFDDGGVSFVDEYWLYDEGIDVTKNTYILCRGRKLKQVTFNLTDKNAVTFADYQNRDYIANVSLSKKFYPGKVFIYETKKMFISDWVKEEAEEFIEDETESVEDGTDEESQDETENSTEENTEESEANE